MTKTAELAKSFKVDMFADRPTAKEAYDYAHEIARGCGPNQVHVLTAVQVVVNTLMNEIIASEENNDLDSLTEIRDDVWTVWLQGSYLNGD